MLTIYIKGTNLPDNLVIEDDAERAFDMTTVSGTELDKKLIEVIEQGKYLDENRFIDRFDTALYYSNMSTGCKAALAIANNPNLVLDVKECAWDTLNAIVAYCTTGNILMDYPDDKIGIQCINNKWCDMNINVCIDGLYFSNTKDLHHYLEVEWEENHPEVPYV